MQKIMAKFCSDAVSRGLMYSTETQQQYVLVHGGGWPSNNCGDMAFVAHFACMLASTPHRLDHIKSGLTLHGFCACLRWLVVLSVLLLILRVSHSAHCRMACEQQHQLYGFNDISVVLQLNGAVVLGIFLRLIFLWMPAYSLGYSLGNDFVRNRRVDLVARYAAQQLNEFHGKKLRLATTDGLGIVANPMYLLITEFKVSNVEAVGEQHGKEAKE